MKYLILALLLTGCRPIGMILKGGGDGLAHAPKAQQPIHCTKTAPNDYLCH